MNCRKGINHSTDSACISGSVPAKPVRASVGFRVTAIALIISMLASGCANLPAPGLAELVQTNPLADPTKPVRVLDNKLETRPVNQLNELFKKRKVTGRELMTEILRFQKAARDRKFDSLIDSSLNSLQKAPSINLTDWKGVLIDMGRWILEDQLTNYGVESLNAFLNEATVGKGRDVLAEEVIELPQLENPTPQSMQQVLNLAGILAIARVAGKGLAASDKSFQRLETQGKELLDTRESYAGFLVDFLSKRKTLAAAQGEVSARDMDRQLKAVFNSEDLKILDEKFSTLTPERFQKDFGLQEAAARFMQRQDPNRFKQYDLTRKDFATNLQAYKQGVTGAIAMGGAAVAFVGVVGDLYKAKDGKTALNALPLLFEIAKESRPLVSKALDVGAKGLDFESRLFPKQFSVLNGAEIQEVRGSGEVFRYLKGKGDLKLFQDSMVRDQPAGLLMRVYACQPEEVGRMLDSMLDRSDVDAVAKRHLGVESSGKFTFENGFGQLQGQQKTRLVEFIQKDLSNTPGVADVVVKAQRQLLENANRLSSGQLTRLVLANNVGKVSQANLQAGNTMVALQPTSATLYEYESLFSGCTKSLAQAAVPVQTEIKNPTAGEKKQKKSK